MKKTDETQENTHRKVTKYKFSEEKSSTVEERPFMPLPTLHLDLTKRYSYADYLTWFDDVRRELIDGFIHLMSEPNTRILKKCRCLFSTDWK